MSLSARPQEGLALSHLVSWIDGIDLPMFVMVLTEEDRLEFVHANRALCRATNLDIAHLTGSIVAEVFPARVAERLETNYRQCLESDDTVSYEESFLVDGQETWWQTTLSKPDGFDGNVILGVSVTITDRKARDFAAAEALADLSAKFDELRLFSTMAAHDARSPLATVSSLIDIILDGFEDMGDGKPELLKMVSDTVDEALTQITATLERGRAFQNGAVTEVEVDLNRLCTDIAAMIDPEMRLTIDLPDLVVVCDEVVVQMGVRNLMANAARHCEFRIAVDARAAGDGEHLVIDISDDGLGLPEGAVLSDLTRIGAGREGSHGFGLASIAQVLQSRGGTLSIVPADTASALRGARFRMVFPGRIVSGGTRKAARALEDHTPRLLDQPHSGAA